MKPSNHRNCITILVAGALAAGSTFAEEKPATNPVELTKPATNPVDLTKPPTDPVDLTKSASNPVDPKKTEEMTKKAEAAGTPGEAHKALEPLIGEWTAEVTCWMTPGATPTVSKGTAKSTWAFDGRFVQEEFKGEMMGKPFTGMSLTGYDNQKEKYNIVWVDDMSTAMLLTEGTAEDGGKVLTFTGKMDCPATGEKDVPVKQVIRIVSPDKHVFEMHDPRKGDQSKTMEITYTRTAATPAV